MVDASKRIATVRTIQIIKIDYIELWRNFITVFIQQIMVVGNLGQVIKFEIINKHAEAFLYMLFDDMLNDKI